VGLDEKALAHANKLVEREAGRLRESLEAARSAGCRRMIMVLHYPPTNILEEESVFTRMAEEYGVEQVVYAHSHGKDRFGDSIQGYYHGIYYRLVSGDFLNWQPARILD
jgi:predicted phosphohydrolase